MVIREAAMGKESSHREESSPMDVASPPLTNTDIGMTISSNIDQSIQGGTTGIDDSAQMDKAAVRTKTGANIIKDSVIEPSSDADMNGIDNSGDEVTDVFGFNASAELVNGRAAMVGFFMLILTELVFHGRPVTSAIFGIN